MKKNLTREELQERVARGKKHFQKLVEAHIILSLIEAQGQDTVVSRKVPGATVATEVSSKEDMQELRIVKTMGYLESLGYSITKEETVKLLDQLEKDGSVDKLFEETGLKEELEQLEKESGESYQIQDAISEDVVVKPTMFARVKGAFAKPLRIVCEQMAEQCNERIEGYEEMLSQQKENE